MNLVLCNRKRDEFLGHKMLNTTDMGDSESFYFFFYFHPDTPFSEKHKSMHIDGILIKKTK